MKHCQNCTEEILREIQNIRGSGINNSSIYDVCEHLKAIDSSLSCIDTSVSALSD